MWKYNHKGKEVVKPLECWAWEVFYADGTNIKQFDEHGRFHKLDEIQDKPISLVRVVRTTDPTRTIEVEVDSHKDIFYFYRNTVLNFGTPQEVRFRTIVFGSDKENKVYYMLGDRVKQRESKDIKPIKLWQYKHTK